MVHISRLNIQGFKSFGSKRASLSLGPGLIVITGPNGGGKSTVVDAIKFCLGESSAHNLRASRFSDLLHESPSEGRSDYAKVTLTLDNRGRGLPMDVDEVTVTRRLASSGESEYLLNGRQVSRSDILAMLGTANIRPDGLNIITQGSVVSVAEMNGLELRQMVEEVAGVAEYKRRRTDAQAQLDIAEKNLEVAKAGTAEVRNRLKQLEMERNHYLQRLICEREVNRLRSTELLAEHAKLSQLLAEADTEILQTTQRAQAKEDERQELLRKRSELDAAFAKLEDSARANSSDVRSVEARVVDARNTINRFETEIISIENLIRDTESAAERLAKRFDETKRILQGLEANKIELEGLRQSLVEKIEVHDKRHRQLAGELSQLRKLKESSEDRLKTLISQMRRDNVSEDGRSLLLEDLAQQDQSVGEELTALRSLLDSKRRLLETVDAELTNLTAELSNLELAEKQLSEELQAARQAKAVAEAKLTELRNADSELQASIAMVQVLLEKSDEMATWEDGESPRLVGSLVTVSENNRRIVSAVLDGWEYAVVCESMDQGLALASLAAKSGIPLKVFSGRVTAGTSLPFDITADPQVGALLGRLFDGLRIADTVHDLGSDETEKTVTRDGVLFLGDGRISVAGERRVRTAQLVSRLAELTHLRERVAGSITKALERIERLEIQMDTMNLNSSNLRTKRASCQLRMHHVTENLESLRTSIVELESKIGQLEKRRSELAARREALLTQPVEVDERLKELDRVSEHVRQLRSDTETLGKEVDQESAELNRAQHDLTDLETQIARLESSITARKEGLVAIQTEWKAAQERRDELSKKLVEKRQLLSETKDRHDQAVKELEAAKQSAAWLDSMISDNRRQWREANARLEEISLELEAIGKSVSSLKLERLRIENSLSIVSGKLAALGIRPGETLDEMSAQFPDGIMAGLEEELAEKSVVNQLAPAQYEALVPSYKLRSSRINELEAERLQIIGLIRTIDGEEAAAFSSTLKKVSEAFGFYFQQLTGGSGWLRLEDETNPLKSGVEMVVQFVGKQARSSAAVSGGEKSVAAISLIIALQIFTPAEFYVFDEVDAHLDINYSTKLAALLKEMSGRGQIIVVTLKDIVAEKADVLYGVYMKGGVSSIVKTTLEEAIPAV